MTGNHASDGLHLFEGPPETGLAPWDGFTIAIPVTPAAATEPFTPDWTGPQHAAIEAPQAKPEPDIPLEELAAWVESCIEQASRDTEAARGHAEEASAAFELSQDAHVASERKIAAERAANAAETITSRCSQAMYDPKTEPSPRQSAA